MEINDEFSFDLNLKHICLVEDDSGARSLITRVLEKENYKVTGFADGESFKIDSK